MDFADGNNRMLAFDIDTTTAVFTETPLLLAARYNPVRYQKMVANLRRHPLFFNASRMRACLDITIRVMGRTIA